MRIDMSSVERHRCLLHRVSIRAAFRSTTDSRCYSTSNSFQALCIRRHLETSKFPSLSASTNVLNILTKSRKRRIHSSSPSFGWANTFLDKSVKIRPKLMRRVICAQFLLREGVFANDCKERSSLCYRAWPIASHQASATNSESPPGLSFRLQELGAANCAASDGPIFRKVSVITS